MVSRLVRSGRSWLGVLAAVSGGSGCLADNESSIFIRGAQMESQSDCVYKPDPGGVFHPFGTLDVGLRTEYVAGLLVGNQLMPRGSGQNLRTETARVRLEFGEVRVVVPGSDSDSDREIGSYTVPVTGFVDPGSGTEPGYGIALMPVLDAQTGLALAEGYVSGGVAAGATQRLVSVVKVRGRTLGGKEIESGEFRYTMQVCRGCLVQFQWDEALGQYVCGTGSGSVCTLLMGQDGHVASCADCIALGGGDICQPQ